VNGIKCACIVEDAIRDELSLVSGRRKDETSERNRQTVEGRCHMVISRASLTVQRFIRRACHDHLVEGIS
jgi:hypothetical protein